MKTTKRGRPIAAKRFKGVMSGAVQLSAEERNVLLGGEWKVEAAQPEQVDPDIIPGWMKREKWLTPKRYQQVASSLDVDALAQMYSPQDLMQAVLCQSFGVEAFDDGVRETARRVLGYYDEYSFRNHPPDYMPFNFTTFAAEKGQMVTCDHIEFSSICKHHLLPFYGYAHVGYIPGELQVGLSKIPRLVQLLAHRPQVQESLGEQIAKELKDRLQPLGVMVVVEARHTCMACRGVQSHNAMMRTSVLKGVFLTSGDARSEFLTLIRGDVL